MKNTIIIILLLLIVGSGYGQTLPRCYSYDAAGNRTSKSVNCIVARIDVVQDDAAAFEQTENRSISERKVAVYPNPSTGQIRIQVSGFSPATLWSLTSMTGTAVLPDQALITADYDLSHLPAGTYYMRWIDGKKPEVVSIIIINE